MAPCTKASPVQGEVAQRAGGVDRRLKHAPSVGLRPTAPPAQGSLFALRPATQRVQSMTGGGEITEAPPVADEAR